MVQKSVLILGGSSFVGKNLLEQVPREWDIVATYCNNSNFEEFCKDKDNVEAEKVDLLGEINVSRDSFDVIIYIAANSDPKKSLENPEEDFKLNADGVEKILEKVSCKKFIYFSSGAVMLEKDIPYTISKKAGEANVKRLAKEKGFDYIILRLFEAFGPYSPERKIFRRIAEALEKGEKEFKIQGDGTNFVDPMYVEDTARGVVAVVEGNEVNVTVDLCTGEPMTITQVAESIGKIYNVDLSLSYEGEPVEKVTFKGNPVEMKKLFGFEKKISFEEGIEKWRKRNLE